MTDVDDIMKFLHEVTSEDDSLEMISFHGGEPFVYVNVMDELIERISTELPKQYMFFIQTNGSLITKNEDFIKKWNNKLRVSISYDFLYQGINRTDFDIVATANMLNEHGVDYIQYQYVMPIQDPAVFSFESLKNIIDVCRSTKVPNVNLIPLRHIRGKDKFKVIVDEINLPEFFGAFLTFTQMLYVQKISVVIDGHGKEIDKNYFENHKQLVLSPDGYIYPEYDFLEYKIKETRLGKWRDEKIVINRDNDPEKENQLLNIKCITCPSRSSCGIKFLYQLFEKQPGDACVIFYSMVDAVIKHNIKLKQHTSLFESIGL